MEFQEVIATLAFFAPYVVTMSGLVLLDHVVRHWTPRGPRSNTRELVFEALMGAWFMATSIKQAVGIMLGPKPVSFAEGFPVVFTAVAVLILLNGTYERVRDAIKLARASG